MGFRRLGGVALIVLAGGCALVSGAADLSVGDDGSSSGASGSTPPAVTPPGAAEGGAPPGTDGGLDGSGQPPGPPPPPPSDAGLDAAVDAGATRVRTLTFEDGTAVGAKGFDSVVGQANVTTLSPLSGSYTFRAEKEGSWGNVVFATETELWISSLIRVESVSATGDADLLTVGLEGSHTIVVQCEDPPNGLLEIEYDGTPFGSAPGVVSGNAERLALHLRAGNGNALVEVWLVEGSGAHPVTPLISSSTLTFTGMNGLRVGITGTDNAKARYDDIIVDRAALP